MSSLKTIGVLGAGHFGTALAWLLATNGHAVLLYDVVPGRIDQINQTHYNAHIFPHLQLPKQVVATNNLGLIAQRVSFIFVAVPTQSMRAVLTVLRSVLTTKKEIMIINGAKGIECGSGLRPSQIVQELLISPFLYGMLSGPNFAREIIKKIPTATVVASTEKSIVQTAQKLLASSFFRVYGSSDVIGVELAGSLKNVLAIAVGIHDSLNLGANSRAALLTRGMAELGRLMIRLGAHKETLLGLSGLGDVFLSCTTTQSRNYSLGMLIGQHSTVPQALKTIGSTVEGVATTQSVLLLAKKYNVEMPIAKAVFEILFKKKTPQKVLSELMQRPWKYE